VSPFAAEALAEGVCALTGDPARAAVFCDIDGTPASVVDQALDALVADGRLDSAVRVGVRSEEGPRNIVIRADLLTGGVERFARVLEGLLGAAR
jgi:hypothetical protein